jgi:hypothetical protein
MKRTRNTARGRFFLGVFMVAWLNLAVQPCVIAMESIPEPDVVSAQSVHEDHANHAADHNCDHCPPVLSVHANTCASAVTSDCGSIAEYNYEGRNASAKLKDLPPDTGIAIPANSIDFNVPDFSPPPLNCAAPDFSGEPSLNIRFCVFLK